MPQEHRGRLEKSQIETNDKMVRWTRVVGIFTTILAVLNFPTLLAVGWQAYTASVVAKETREQLRAVLQFSGVQALAGPLPDNKGATYGFVSSFQNLGGTRAQNVSAWHSVQYFEGAVPFNADFTKPSEQLETVSPTNVGANATMSLVPVAVKPGQTERAMKQEGVIVIWGKLTYSDIYSPSEKHNVSFCQRLLPTQQKADSLIQFGVTPFRGDCNTSN